MLSQNLTIAFNPFIPSRRCSILTGRTFGYLKVFSLYAKNQRREIQWLCQCSCGNWKVARSADLLQGCIYTCGQCKLRINPKQRTRKKRPRQRIPEQSAYYAAKSRCTNPCDKAYHNYGGRGIQFNFQSFEEFFCHVGRRPTARHSIDRINNNGHYELGNVQWAIPFQQAQNRRNTRLVTCNNITKTISEWIMLNNIKRGCVRSRLQRGWCDSCAVTPNIKHCVH